MSTVVRCDNCGKQIPDGELKICDWKIGKMFACTDILDGGKCDIEQLTCDKDLCRDCAIHILGDVDLCPQHAEELMHALAFKLGKLPDPTKHKG